MLYVIVGICGDVVCLLTIIFVLFQGGVMFGAPGAGGQMGYADADHHIGWAYLTNFHSIYAIGDDPKYLALERAIYECVQDIEKKGK